MLKRGCDRAYYPQIEKIKILADVFRNRLNKHNKISDIVSGLVNYRIMKQQN